MSMKSIRSWFTEERASDVAPNYTDRILDAQLAAARGIDGIKSTAAYRGALTLISHSVGVASLTGQHSDRLQGHLSQIAREMVSAGESTWVISVSSTGGVELLPCSVLDVLGGPTPATWLYTLMLNGPSQTVTVQRPGESILSFRLRTDAKTPWRGRPAITAAGTAALLCELESQMHAESRVAPARVIAVGAVPSLSDDVSELIGAGGIVGVSQATGSREDSSPVKAGIIRNETPAPSVSLHTTLATMICGALGCPPDLVFGGNSESGSRESMRRFGSTTIQNLMVTIAREWQLKLGMELLWDLDQLRSSDEVSRARATGSRANAVQRLVQSGVELPKALAIAGID